MHETRCQEASRTYMATVIEDVRKRDKENMLPIPYTQEIA